MDPYSFCKFKIPINGSRVIWEVTNECNYGCKFCIFSSTGKKPIGELTTEKFLNTIEELSIANFNHIKFTGGEPFLRKDIIEILHYCHQKKMRIDISTNASKITNEIVSQLNEIDLDYIHVSVDGYNQFSHEIVRGKKSFDPTINGLNLLQQQKNKIRIGTLIHLYNQDKILETLEFLSQYKINEVAFSLMEPVGRLKNKLDLLANCSIASLMANIEKYKELYPFKISHNLSAIKPLVFLKSINSNPSFQVTQTCPGGEKFLFINSTGVVSPCTWVSEYQLQYHSLSLHHYSLSEILNSSKFNLFKKVKKSYPKQNFCPMEDLELFNLIEKENKDEFTSI